MTSISSTLKNYMDLEEVSATLDKLKENALKNTSSMNDGRTYDYKKKSKYNNKHATDSNVFNNFLKNKEEVLSKEHDILDNYSHQKVDTYDVFKSDASNKSKDLDDVFEYDFVNMDGCLYNEHQQLHEGLDIGNKTFGGSCSNQSKSLQEGDEDHNLSTAHQENLVAKKLFDQANSKDKETLNPMNGDSNQVINYDLKYEFSPYNCSPKTNMGSIENYSNDSLHNECCHLELDGKLIEDDNTSMQIFYGHVHDDINNFDVENENIDFTKGDKMKESFLDDDCFSIDKVSNLEENNSACKNHEINSNLNMQEVHESLIEDIEQHFENKNCEQKSKGCAKNGKRNKTHTLNEARYSTRSNTKNDEHDYRSHSNCKGLNFQDINMTTQTFNKIGNKFVKRRFEDFKDRRRIHDRDMPFHIQEFELQGFRKNFNHSKGPHQRMFLRRPNFNERRYNMSHTRHGNNFHNFKNSRMRDRFSDRNKTFYKENSKDNYKNTLQQSSPSPHKEKKNSNHSRKKLKRSLSPLSNDDSIHLEKDSPLIDVKGSLTQDVLECHQRRFKAGSSGLGGYSPRRRRPETTKKTPSPLPRSPDRKKVRAWDMAPPGIDSKVVAAIAAAHTAQQAVSKQVSTLSSIPPIVSMNVINPINNLNVTSNPTLSSMLPSILQQVNQPLSTVTLTQATRSIRRLYVGNVPPTVSDGELMEFMNAAMLSANANHIPRTKPCINCMVNIEKAYAFAEFITPEDATTALGFDGVTLHGTILKIRRPKDFIAPEHGGCPIAQPMINLVADIVLDSPEKVFIGGISPLLTPDKVKEIVTAFGQLRSFHWKTMNQKDCCMAFLEYLDPVVTQKACIGLNGMHLGGQVLTVLQATPNAKFEIFSNNPPFYGIPKEALPLLETPTNVLKLFNLISKEEICNMQDEEVKELMEDVRFECRRFGNIRSMQLVKPPTLHPKPISIVCTSSIMEDEEVKHLVRSSKNFSNVEIGKNDSACEILKETCNDIEIKDNDSTLETIRETYGNDKPKVEESTLENIRETYGVGKKSPSPNEGENFQNNEATEDFQNGEAFEEFQNNETSKEIQNNKTLEEFQNNEISEELQNNKASHDIKDPDEIQVSDIASISSRTDCGQDFKIPIIEETMQPTPTLKPPTPTTDINCEIKSTKPLELEPFEVGHIFIEYSRIESACQAAHALRGRHFGQLKVEVMYVPPRLYYKYFGKGSCMQTHQEKKTLSLAVQEHLTDHITN